MFSQNPFAEMLCSKMKKAKQNGFIDYIIIAEKARKMFLAKNIHVPLEIDCLDTLKEDIKKVVISQEFSNINWNKYTEELKNLKEIFKEEEKLDAKNDAEKIQKLNEKKFEYIFAITDEFNTEETYKKTISFLFSQNLNYSLEIQEIKDISEKHKININNFSVRYDAETALICSRKILKLISGSRLDLIKDKCLSLKKNIKI